MEGGMLMFPNRGSNVNMGGVSGGGLGSGGAKGKDLFISLLALLALCEKKCAQGEQGKQGIIGLRAERRRYLGFTHFSVSSASPVRKKMRAGVAG